jgi:hypothetical protein
MESYLHPNQELEDQSLLGAGQGYSLIRSNTRKAFFKNLINMMIILIVVIGMIVFIDQQVGLDTFTMVFEMLGMTVTTGQIIFYIIVLVTIICIGMLLANYMAISHVRYELYKDHIKYYETQAFILTNSDEISYENVIRVNFKSEGFMNKLMSCGDVIISLTNHKRENITLQSIDDPEMIARLIQSKINDYNMQKQMVYQQSNRIDSILKRF